MTEQTYTIEEIETAFNTVGNRCKWDDSWGIEDVLAELTKLKWEPEIGQVVVSRVDEKELIYRWDKGYCTHDDLFPLNQTEVGPGWVARDRVEKLVDALEIARNRLIAMGDSDSHRSINKALNTFNGGE